MTLENKPLTVTVNGEPKHVPEGLTLRGLLIELGIESGKVAIEHNRAIAPRSRFGETALADGDQIEIVRFVGGG